MDLSDMTYQTFAGLRGETFEIGMTDGTRVPLEVVEVTEAVGENRPDQAFSVLFEGPSEPFLAQGTYVLESESAGSIALFLVPIAEAEGGFRYEAVFTKLEPAAGSE